MKQFLKPFILEWKLAAQRKRFNLNEVKPKNSLLENKTLPPSNVASNGVHSLTFTAVSYWFRNTSKKETPNHPTEKHPTNHHKQLNKTTPLTQPLPQQSQAVSWKPRHWALRRQVSTSLATTPSFPSEGKKDITQPLSFFSCHTIPYASSDTFFFSTAMQNLVLPDIRRYEEQHYIWLFLLQRRKYAVLTRKSEVCDL